MITFVKESFREMNKMDKKNRLEEIDLLKRFNNRESIAFGEVYSLFYRELSVYVASLYRDVTMPPEDVVHDVFINLWLSSMKFEQLINLKAYIYVSIKNGFKNYLAHTTHVVKYTKQMSVDEDFGIDVMESELYSFVDESLKILPKSYAVVIDLYLKGWKLGEIAETLTKSEQYVYNTKNKAIAILRKKLDKDKLFIINILLN